MRLTLTLYRWRIWRETQQKWARKGEFKTNPPLRPPQALIDRGIEVVDPLEDFQEKTPQWEPPVPDPRFPKPERLEESINYHEEPAYVMYPTTNLLEGIDQACILTKSLALHGMPKPVEELIGAVTMPDRDLLLQRYIMQSQFWNTNQKRLPKRVDIRKPGWKFKTEYGITDNDSATILCRNLIRYSNILTDRFPSMVDDRRIVYKPYLESYYHFKGDKLITFTGRNEWTVYGKEPLPPFVGEDNIDNTVHTKLPDIFPISPTIDLAKEYCYTMRSSTGYKKQYSKSCPQTIFKFVRPFSSERYIQSNALLTTFGYALATARQIHGQEVKTLPKPLSFQCITMSENKFNFLFFQLNTMSYDNEDGVKNIVWFDSGYKLFEKVYGQPWMPKAIRYMHLKDYDPSVFERFMAVFLQGVPEVKQLVARDL